MINDIQKDGIYLYVPILKDDETSVQMLKDYNIALHIVDRVLLLKVVLKEEDYNEQLELWNTKYPTLNAE